MPRYTSTFLQSALDSDSYQFATLIAFGTAPNILALTDNDTDISYESLNYSSSGLLLSFDNVSEAQTPTVGGLEITLSGVSQTAVSFMLSGDHVGMPVKVQRAVLGSQTAAFNYFIGQVENFSISETGQTSELQIQCSSHWADFEKKNGRKTNHNSQQLHFSGDNGFEFAASTISDIKWGKK